MKTCTLCKCISPSYIPLLIFDGIFLGAEVVIKNSSDCDRSFELTELSEMMINFFNDVRANCSLTINGSEGIDKHTRKCIEPEELNYGGCTVQVDVHNFIYLENSGDKVRLLTEGKFKFCFYVYTEEIKLSCPLH